ncbi:hypothetical protein D3C85_469150 [compost metagenome]
MIYPIKIVGCVVDYHNVTLYKADGDTIVIPQGDPRLRDLVAKLEPALRDNVPVAQRFYLLTTEDMQDRNHFADAEKKMGGVVRFFKMVKSKAKELLEKFVEPIEPMVLGTKEAIKTPPVPVHMVNGEAVDDLSDFEPVVEEAKPVLPPEEERPLTKSAAAVAEIMANAVPASNPNFSVPDVKGEEETTVIAVLGDNTVIPGCEALTGQAAAMSEGIGSGTGMQNFLQRAGMIRRGHSVEDLLKFIQKGELPLADDGCVLVYKLLRRTKDEGVFVDCHSGNVKQRVGSFVHMDEKMVDPNRLQDCSNGLHVARRDYLKNFGGDVCVLAKLAPEDVIAVPQYDARKLRAKGYHIIAELSDADKNRVCGDKPMEDQVLLGNAIAGNHVGILEHVEITQQKGGGLKITPVEGVVEGAPALDHSLTGSSLDHLPVPGEMSEHNVVDARALALETAAPKPMTIFQPGGDAYVPMLTEPHMPVVEQALAEAPKPKVTLLQSLLDAWVAADTATDKLIAAKSLLTFKKQSKKSWTALGVSITVWEAATKLVELEAVAQSLPKAVSPNDDHLLSKVPKVKKAAPPLKPTPAPKPIKAKKPSTPKVKAVETTLKAPPVPKTPGKRSQKEEAAHLLEIYTNNPDFINAKQLVAFKKGTKKGWEAIGIDEKLGKKLEARVKV